jgi:putative ABC transport system permease protein
VSSVTVKQDAIDSMDETLNMQMEVMSFMTIFFAGIIAFSIIYNITSVSLSERERELASLRVMGFSKQEVGRTLYYENILMGIVGLILGVPFGMLLCKGLVTAFDTEMIRIPYHLEPSTFAISIACTIIFVIISNYAIRHKINNLDLVETLKERE